MSQPHKHQHQPHDRNPNQPHKHQHQPHDRNPNQPHRPQSSQPMPAKQEPDFFQQLQTNEQQKGLAARGGGYAWTTFFEIILNDW